MPRKSRAAVAREAAEVLETLTGFSDGLKQEELRRAHRISDWTSDCVQHSGPTPS